MIRKRFEYDGKSILKLNRSQKEIKLQIEKKVKEQIYKFESEKCPYCHNDHFIRLSNKDRYGLFYPIVICPRCGLIQANPRMNAEAYTEFYNKEYRILYNATKKPLDSFFQERYRQGRRIYSYLKKNKILDNLPLKPKILEIGCSSGGILKYFKDKGFITKGYDLDSDYINHGRKNYNLDLNIGTIKDANLDYSPEIIIYSHVLEHIIDIVEELANIRKILPDNGNLYIEVPGIKCLKTRYKQDFLRYLQNAHIFHFTLESLTNLMNKSGFIRIVGDDDIRSIFKKGESKPIKYSSEYSKTMLFLYKLEYFKIYYIIRMRLKSFFRKVFRLIEMMIGRN